MRNDRACDPLLAPLESVLALTYCFNAMNRYEAGHRPAQAAPTGGDYFARFLVHA